MRQDTVFKRILAFTALDAEERRQWGWRAMDPGKDDRTIRAVFKMPPNPGPSEGICESLDAIDRLLEEEGES